uniref:Uncharacterized protein n=1 Tax=Parascaris univalens TaxID=6257 RepID=A0A915AGI6_PARUN
YLGHLYNSKGQRATLLTWECENADCCQVSCCARSAIIFHIAIIMIVAVVIFVLLRYIAKLSCRKVQIAWHRRRKTINKEKVERLKYFGTRLVRSQQEYFNSISSLHQIPNVPAAMPIAAQSGESSPKPPLLYERLLPFMAKRRLESRTSLTNSHHKPTYETSGVLISQQVSGKRSGRFLISASINR